MKCFDIFFALQSVENENEQWLRDIVRDSGQQSLLDVINQPMEEDLQYNIWYDYSTDNMKSTFENIMSTSEIIEFNETTV